MKPYLILFFLTGPFLVQNPAPAAVNIEDRTTAQIAAMETDTTPIEEKGAWLNVVSLTAGILSLVPFFLGGLMLLGESLFFFITGLSLLAVAQIMVLLAIGMAFAGVIFGILGRKRQKAESGRTGIILGLIIMVLSALLLIL